MEPSNFKTADQHDRLLELISNQLQLANLQQWSAKSNPAQVDKLRFRIINQRAELGIAVDGV